MNLIKNIATVITEMVATMDHSLETLIQVERRVCSLLQELGFHSGVSLTAIYRKGGDKITIVPGNLYTAVILGENGKINVECLCSPTEYSDHVNSIYYGFFNNQICKLIKQPAEVTLVVETEM